MAYYCSQDPLLAKALTCMEVLSWIKEKKWSKVILETDCQKLFKAINYPQSNLSIYGMIVQNCLKALFVLTECSLSFIKGSSNQVAHLLGKAIGSQAGPEE